MTPWKRWAIQCGLILSVIFFGVALFKSCVPMEPIVIPDWADSLASARDAYTMDSVYWAEQHEADSARAAGFQRDAESWRRRSLAARPARVPRVGTTAPDSGVANNVAINPDSVSDNAHLRAVNDSLWAALDLADSAYASLDSAFQSQRKDLADMTAWKNVADSTMKAERLITDRAIKDLTARLRKAQRGSRLLGFLPMPEVVCGYGATLAAGAVQHGPSCTAGIRVRL